MKQKGLRFLAKMNPLRKIYIVMGRYRRAMSYFRPKLKLVRKWAWDQTEFSNFYYPLSKRNIQELTCMVSIVTGKKIELVDSLAQEIILNENLYLKLTQQLNDEGLSRKETITIGRRVGWYVLIRILKPRVVVETGVHHGVGACVISEALRRNQMEGFRGKYIGTEININHGKLFNQNYSDVGKIVYGDSIKTLSNLTEEIDIFINDSDHDSNYERNEYYAILKNLNKSSLVIGDNAHVSDELQKFSMDKGRHYLVFHEEPMGHWYPGGAIGMSIREIPTKEFQ